MNAITYDKDALPFILDVLRLDMDRDGFIIDRWKHHVPSTLNDPKVHFSRMAGFINTDKGIRIMMDDICSIIKMVDDEAGVPVPAPEE